MSVKLKTDSRIRCVKQINVAVAVAVARQPLTMCNKDIENCQRKQRERVEKKVLHQFKRVKMPSYAKREK